MLLVVNGAYSHTTKQFLYFMGRLDKVLIKISFYHLFGYFQFDNMLFNKTARLYTKKYWIKTLTNVYSFGSCGMVVKLLLNCQALIYL